MSDAGVRDSKGLLLGRLGPGGHDGAEYVTADGDLHVLTIAPNLSGRSRHCLIPNLLTYTGRAVVVDLDGEAYAATAEARRRMGHTVVRLDPFGVTGPESDALDPIRLLPAVEESGFATRCQDLAALLPLRSSAADLLGHETLSLINALIAYLAVVPEKNTFDELYPTLHSDDVVYSLAVVLDAVGKRIPKPAFEQIASFLDTDDRTRSRILSRARARVEPLGNPQVRRTLRTSTVSLSAFAAGEPTTVYLILPAGRLGDNTALLRVWIGSLLYAVSGAHDDSALPVLFLLDYCADLGPFGPVESALRRGAADAFRIWTFWHGVYQLRSTYPGTWPEIVSGSGAVQVFGTTDTAAAAEVEQLLGLPSNAVWSLGPADQVVRLGKAAQQMKKLDLRDGAFAPPG
ncbi:type IV secretory system conjugative DNA transfer family protein [Actinacidiphila paucisporea]|uniref:Type IV secretion system protein VirD4 n=1 Tax=Actinacidiphila paucisporea TaxID=310782 RepID=A0A1M7QWC3_9ACTN|nr:type IV secretory system conjugative DNA transfer family protein [Actinacidiphila paucisporea]SHN36205.1 type IV secretion system protein VirD4 [Actinacidiphila paucisporea]